MASGKNSDVAPVRKRPAWLRALGDNDPPAEITVEGRVYRRANILKHDSWAATALYSDDAGERIICKFNRVQSVAGVPLAWIGRALARREAGFLRRLADIELVPKGLDGVVVAGQRLPNAVARRYIEGEPFRTKEQVSPQFFEELRDLLAKVHATGMAYVDLHKRENIIVDRGGHPHLIDFQVCVGLSQSWPGNSRLARYFVRKMQEIDTYHFKKHVVRTLPQMLSAEERADYEKLPPLIRAHRKIAVPLRTLRRRLLVSLRVRDAEGRATSEFEPEDAYREKTKET